MKPFDLERALAGDPVVTRDGKKVKRIAYFPDVSAGRRVIAQIGEELFYFCDDGCTSIFDRSSHGLFMDPKKVTMWANIFERGSKRGYIYATQADAECAVPHNESDYFAIAVPIEVEL